MTRRRMGWELSGSLPFDVTAPKQIRSLHWWRSPAFLAARPPPRQWPPPRRFKPLPAPSKRDDH